MENFISNNNDLFVTGQIGSDFLAEDFIKQLNYFPKDEVINVHLYSGGGSLFDGLAVYDFVKLKGIKINAYVSGLCGSACTIIAMACDNVYIGENSYFFIHRAFSTAEPTPQSKLFLDSANEKLISIYQKRTGLSKPKIKQLLDAGDKGAFLSSEDSVSLGFCNSKFKESQLVADIDFHKEYSNQINNNMAIENPEEFKNSIISETVDAVKNFFAKKEKEVSIESIENSVMNEVSTKFEAIEKDFANQMEVISNEKNAEIEALKNEIEALKMTATNIVNDSDPAPIEEVKEVNIFQEMTKNLLNSATDEDKLVALTKKK